MGLYPSLPPLEKTPNQPLPPPSPMSPRALALASLAALTFRKAAQPRRPSVPSMNPHTIIRSFLLSRWKHMVVMSSSSASWQMGSLWSLQNVLVQAEHADGTRFSLGERFVGVMAVGRCGLGWLAGSQAVSWRLEGTSSGVSEKERKSSERRRLGFASGFLERGIMVLFLKQVHLQKVWGAVGELLAGRGRELDDVAREIEAYRMLLPALGGPPRARLRILFAPLSCLSRFGCRRKLLSLDRSCDSLLLGYRVIHNQMWRSRS